MSTVVAEFDVKKDDRNRVKLKNVPFDRYHAKVFDDGHIEFYPQVLADASLSVLTLAMMIRQWRTSRAGSPAQLSIPATFWVTPKKTRGSRAGHNKKTPTRRILGYR